MLNVKGHKSDVHSWSEVIATKLRSLCPNQSEPNKDDLILSVRLLPAFPCACIDATLHRCISVSWNVPKHSKS